MSYIETSIISSKNFHLIRQSEKPKDIWLRLDMRPRNCAWTLATCHHGKCLSELADIKNHNSIEKQLSVYFVFIALDCLIVLGCIFILVTSSYRLIIT